MMPESETPAKRLLGYVDELYQSASALLGANAAAEAAVERTFRRAKETLPIGDERLRLYSLLLAEIRRARRPRLLTWVTSTLDGDVLNALRELPVDEGEAVLLCDVQEFGYREASSILGVSIEALVKRLSRGRDRLAQKLECKVPAIAASA